MRRYSWVYKSVDDLHLLPLCNSLNISKHFAELLYKRGITSFDSAKAFFCKDENDLHSPFLLKNIDKAIERLQQCIDEEEDIIIYGDYDVDGTTSTALLYIFLTTILHYPKERIHIYIPDRIKEGYGVHEFGMEYIYKKNPKLVIMVDCGTSSLDYVRRLEDKGIQSIVCDHHLPSGELPNDFLLLNPKQQGCTYPFKELSACALVYKFVEAMAITLGVKKEAYENLLDLVALSLAADIVSLMGENRILMSLGIEQLDKKKRLSIAKLADLCKIDKFTVENIVFGIAPKINAAGRMIHAKYAVDMLLSQDEKEIQSLVADLSKWNTQRRVVQQEVFEQASVKYEAQKDNFLFATVVYDSQWFKGVLGIVASKLVEAYCKPTIVFTVEGDYMVGSARSIDDIDIYTMLCQCSKYLVNFGGHTKAAGLKIKKIDFEAFASAFNEAVGFALKGQIPTLNVVVDADLNFKFINANTMNILERMKPYGPDNLNPNWLIKGVQLIEAPRVLKDKHLSLNFKQDDSIYPSILFGFANAYLPYLQVGSLYDIVVRLKNEMWNNKLRTSLIIQDMDLHQS